MRLVLFVEGHTEQQAVPGFLKRWLDPRLDLPIRVQAVRFEGWPELVKDLETKAHMYLRGDKSRDVVAVVSLLDLYGPTFYPGHVRSARERVDWARKELEARVRHPKFRAFFAVHELEAWLLSDPRLFDPAIQRALPKSCAQPETIDFDEPPAKLLQHLFRTKLKRTYKKTTDGSVLFRRLDPELTYHCCPELRRMLDELLSLALAAAV